MQLAGRLRTRDFYGGAAENTVGGQGGGRGEWEDVRVVAPEWTGSARCWTETSVLVFGLSGRNDATSYSGRSYSVGSAARCSLRIDHSRLMTASTPAPLTAEMPRTSIPSSSRSCCSSGGSSLSDRSSLLATTSSGLAANVSLYFSNS